MHGRYRSLAVARFPVMGSKLSTFCLFVEVSPTGRVRHKGMIRAPASDRPKKGGGRAVPSTALNPAGWVA